MEINGELALNHALENDGDFNQCVTSTQIHLQNRQDPSQNLSRFCVKINKLNLKFICRIAKLGGGVQNRNTNLGSHTNYM